MHVHVHAMETVSGAEAAFSLWEAAGAVEAFRRESPLSTSNGPVPATRSGVDGTNTGGPLLAPPGGGVGEATCVFTWGGHLRGSALIRSRKGPLVELDQSPGPGHGPPHGPPAGGNRLS